MMGFQDRRYGPQDGEEGGFRRALKRIFVEGDDFFSWALPLFRFKGIDVRIHLLYIVFIVGELIWPIRRDAMGFAFAAFSMGTLFLFVLLHEFGHCFAARRVGGEADRIVMWPLGGLAFTRPPHNWKADLITVLGGPAVNLVLIPILGLALLATGAGWGVLVFNPLRSFTVFADPWFSFNAAYWKIFLWSAYATNLGLFLFNMLLVMYPMDAGRIVQDLLWRKVGYRRSVLIATNLGLVMAIIVGMVAFFVLDSRVLGGIAVFCGITCFMERRRAAMLEDETYDLGSPVAYGYGPRSPAIEREEDRSFARAARIQQQQREEQAEVDRILAKIAASGMGSLSRGERKVLERETERKRKQGEGDAKAAG